MAHTNTQCTSKSNLASYLAPSERGTYALESPLVKLHSNFLLLLLFQWINCVLPNKAYSDAIIEEFIDNVNSQHQEPPADSSAFSHNNNVVKRKTLYNESFSMQLMKLLLRARIDLLLRVHEVLEHDNKTLIRMGEEQALRIDHNRRNYEDLFIRMRHMEKILHCTTIKILELRQRIDSAQLVSADGTFVWNIDQVFSKPRNFITIRKLLQIFFVPL